MLFIILLINLFFMYNLRQKKLKYKHSIDNIAIDIWFFLKFCKHKRFNKNYGAKEFGNLGPFHIKPKAHAEEEEMSEDEQRRFKLLGYTAEDNPILGKLRSGKEKEPRLQWQSPRVSQRKAQAQWASHESMVKEQFQGRLSPPH